MIIGQRLREIRDTENLSQDDIERATGLGLTFLALRTGIHSRLPPGPFQ